MIKLLVAQTLNGALLPVILLFFMRLGADAELTGGLKNTMAYNLFG